MILNKGNRNQTTLDQNDRWALQTTFPIYEILKITNVQTLIHQLYKCIKKRINNNSFRRFYRSKNIDTPQNLNSEEMLSSKKSRKHLMKGTNRQPWLSELTGKSINTDSMRNKNMSWKQVLAELIKWKLQICQSQVLYVSIIRRFASSLYQLRILVKSITF